MENVLTKEERDFVQKIEKTGKNPWCTYAAVGVLSFLVFVGIFLGIKFHSKDCFLFAIYFGTLGAMTILKTSTDRKMIRIVKKLQNEIEQIGISKPS